MWKFWKKETEIASDSSESASFIKLIVISLLVFVFLLYLLGVYWSSEPDLFNVETENAYVTTGQDKKFIVGYTTVAATEKVASTLLDKPGGYLSNDVLPPSVFLDNIPFLGVWCFGSSERYGFGTEKPH